MVNFYFFEQNSTINNRLYGLVLQVAESQPVANVEEL